MGKVTTSHYKIFDFWKGKGITLEGEVVDGGGDPIILDWGEPNCWACGRRVFRKADDEYKLQEKCKQEDGAFNFEQLWNDSQVKSKLNRCHIVPAALGGEDKPSNLFLLCEECHHLSPDTTNPYNFFRWVYKRKQDYSDGKMSVRKLLADVQSELESRGLKLEECLKDIGTDFKPDTLRDYANQHTGLHATALADSSVIGSVVDWILDQWVDALLKTD